MEMPTSA